MPELGGSLRFHTAQASMTDGETKEVQGRDQLSQSRPES